MAIQQQMSEKVSKDSLKRACYAFSYLVFQQCSACNPMSQKLSVRQFLYSCLCMTSMSVHMRPQKSWLWVTANQKEANLKAGRNELNACWGVPKPSVR